MTTPTPRTDGIKFHPSTLQELNGEQFWVVSAKDCEEIECDLAAALEGTAKWKQRADWYKGQVEMFQALATEGEKAIVERAEEAEQLSTDTTLAFVECQHDRDEWKRKAEAAEAQAKSDRLVVNEAYRNERLAISRADAAEALSEERKQDALAQFRALLEEREARQRAERKAEEATRYSAFIIRYDDADRHDEVFVGHGAEEAVRLRWEQIGHNWNAHLFRKIRGNADATDYYAIADAAIAAKGEA